MGGIAKTDVSDDDGDISGRLRLVIQPHAAALADAPDPGCQFRALVGPI
jgi:hypothetical protein